MMQETAKIFLSYARANGDFALRLGADLRSAGANIWMDKLDVTPGARWDRVTEEALEASKSLIIILSPLSVNSENVMDEVAFALESGKQIFPILYRDCKIPFRLRRIQYTDFTLGYESGFQELLKALKIDSPKVTLERLDDSFSREDVAMLLREKNFFDKSKNESGKGILNKFERINQAGQSLIVDQTTNLMWQPSGSSDEVTCLEGQDYIRELNNQGFAGYSDWRLPKLEEAMSLMKPKQKNGELYIEPIFDRTQRIIWTSSRQITLVWLAGFSVGYCFADYEDGFYHVRAVRSASRLS